MFDDRRKLTNKPWTEVAEEIWSARAWEKEVIERSLSGGVPPSPAAGSTVREPIEAAPSPWHGDATRSAGLPKGLESMPRGAELATLLAGIDRSRVSGFDLGRLLAVESGLISHLQAGMYETMIELDAVTSAFGSDAPAAEISAALRLTRQAGEVEHGLAMGLKEHRDVQEALRDGSIDLRRTRVIIGSLDGLDHDTATAIVARVLPEASSKTTGQLAAQLRRLTMSASPAAAEDTYQAALADRKVVVYDNPDGTASLHATNLPPDRLCGIRQKLEEIARNAKTPDDTRTPDQLRADTFLDLLELQVTGGESKAFVNIDVNLTTLLDLDAEPGHIPGWGPVTAEMARKIVADQTECDWEFTVLDQGRPLATGTLNRRPTSGMKRRIRSRYPTCVHPGCRRPARQSDVDHTMEWARGGKTSLENLAPLCDYHHELKDQGWKYRRQDDGSFEFTSPLGHTYISTGQSP